MRDRDVLLDPTLVAELIANEAEKYSHRKDHISPFAKSAHDHFYDFKGGKPDDVTVVVSQISLSDEAKIKSRWVNYQLFKSQFISLIFKFFSILIILYFLIIKEVGVLGHAEIIILNQVVHSSHHHRHALFVLDI